MSDLCTVFECLACMFQFSLALIFFLLCVWAVKSGAFSHFSDNRESQSGTQDYVPLLVVVYKPLI